MIRFGDREEGHMEISKQELDGGIMKLALNGDLDAFMGAALAARVGETREGADS